MTPLTPHPTPIPTPTAARPRCRAEMFQGADDPTMARIDDLLRRERYSSNPLLHGPSGCGKNTIARRIGSKRCCPVVSAEAVDGCGECDLCVRIRGGAGTADGSYTEINAGESDWLEELTEIASILNGPVITAQGNPRLLPPVFAVDEVQLLNARDQTRLAGLIESHSACFVLATSDLDAIITPLKTRCELLFVGPPDTDAFSTAFVGVLNRHHIPYDPCVPELFRRACKGSVRDALQKASELSERRQPRWTEPIVRDFLGLPTAGANVIY